MAVPGVPLGGGGGGRDGGRDNVCARENFIGDGDADGGLRGESLWSMMVPQDPFHARFVDGERPGKTGRMGCGGMLGCGAGCPDEEVVWDDVRGDCCVCVSVRFCAIACVRYRVCVCLRVCM